MTATTICSVTYTLFKRNRSIWVSLGFVVYTFFNGKVEMWSRWFFFPSYSLVKSWAWGHRESSGRWSRSRSWFIKVWRGLSCLGFVIYTSYKMIDVCPGVCLLPSVVSLLVYSVCSVIFVCLDTVFILSSTICVLCILCSVTYVNFVIIFKFCRLLFTLFILVILCTIFFIV